MKKILLLTLTLFLVSCSDSDSPGSPNVSSFTSGTWRSDGGPTLIIWEMRSGTMWLIPPEDPPSELFQPYALETDTAQDGDTLRVDAWKADTPGLVYSFALKYDGTVYRGRSYSKNNYFPDRSLVFSLI